MGLNSVAINGRMTADAEVKEVGSKTLVARFKIANNEYYKGEERPSFFDVTAFGKTAEVLRDYAKKGSLIGVEGSLRQERWETPEGGKRSKIVIIAKKIEFLDRKKSESSVNTSNTEDYDTNDDMPF